MDRITRPANELIFGPPVEYAHCDCGACETAEQRRECYQAFLDDQSEFDAIESNLS